MENNDPSSHDHNLYNHQQHLLKTDDYLAGGGGGSSGLFDLPLDQKGSTDLFGFQDHYDFISSSPSPSLFALVGHLQPPVPIEVPSSGRQHQQQPLSFDPSPVPVELSEIVNNLATPNSSPMSYSSNGQNRAAHSNKATGDDLDQEDEGQGCGGGSGKEEAEDKDIKL